MVKKIDNCKFRVSFVDVTTSQRVSFARSVGIKDEPYGISYLAVALSIMRLHPEDYPCPNEYLGRVDILVNGVKGVRSKRFVYVRPVNSITFDARVKRIYLEYLTRGYEIDFCYRSYFYPHENFDLSDIIGDKAHANLSHKYQTKTPQGRCRR